MAANKVKYPQVAIDLKNEMSNKKNQHDALRAVAATDADIEDVEEMDADGNVTKAAPSAAASAAPKVPALPPAKLALLEKRFKEMDADGNGSLTKQEIGEIMLLEEGDTTLETLWKAADMDGDAKITFDEFVKAIDAFDKAEEAALDLGLP